MARQLSLSLSFVHPSLWRRARLGGVGILVMGILAWGLWGSPGVFWGNGFSPVAQASSYTELVRQGQAAYQADRSEQAVDLWQQAVQAAATDSIQQAQALSLLSLAYQSQGDWVQATAATERGLQILQGLDGDAPTVIQIEAQSRNTQGQLWAGQGRFEQALTTWQMAAALYERAEDPVGRLGAQLNQAQALQSLGLYRRALMLLSSTAEQLDQQPDSPLKATGLRSLGNALRVVRNPDLSEETLRLSLGVADRLDLPEQRDPTLLSLGNTLRSLDRQEEALELYRQAGQSQDPAIQLRARLNQFSLLIELQRWGAAAELWPQILDQIETSPLSHGTLYARINLSQSLMELGSQWPELDPEGRTALDSTIVSVLTTATQQAQQIQDRRAQSYSLGQLGTFFEQQQQLEQALPLTQQALVIAQGIQAADITYLWHWQLGRIFRQQGQRQAATAQYSEAVQILQSLRTDLVTVNPEVQFSFRDSVEPIYRQLVSLLLEVDPVPQDTLARARELIESLQLAELDNFFRDACLDTETPIASVQLDQVDPQAAVFYPILLPDRMEVILSLPDRPLQHHGVSLAQGELEQAFGQFRQLLENRTNREFLPLSQQVYDWLIRPVASDLAGSGVDTLVFVLDGPLRNLPMAALHDGERFLIETYSMALTPGLQLLDPQPLRREQLQALVAGLTEGRQGFAPLINVSDEIEQIQAQIGAEVLKDPDFTGERLRQSLQRLPFPIVHIATHGQFSSNADETFILTWDDRLDIPQLDGLLRLSGLDQGVTGPIELLTLSACQTATGDDRAALGLAGVAVRAGARSTVASLWYVNDQATVPLISQFYRELTDPTLTKAKALQRAQQQLLAQDQYRHPIYWAPFILVGNWL